MSADQRAEFARTYLTEVSGTSVEQLPPSVLMRERAELQRLLGQVPAVLAEWQAETRPLVQICEVLTDLTGSLTTGSSRAD